MKILYSFVEFFLALNIWILIYPLLILSLFLWVFFSKFSELISLQNVSNDNEKNNLESKNKKELLNIKDKKILDNKTLIYGSILILLSIVGYLII